MPLVEYDRNHSILFRYPHGAQPVIKIKVTNPANNIVTIIENAVVDSGADRSTAPAFIGAIQLQHNLHRIKHGTNIKTPIGIGGSKNPMRGYMHSGIIQIYSGTTLISFLQPLALDICFIEDSTGNSPDCPFVLGREDFFTYFHISFYNVARYSCMRLTPRTDIVL
ncbi:MAG: hypothetical protein WC955_03975 [Elusimicrobiota bacterium]